MCSYPGQIIKIKPGINQDNLILLPKNMYDGPGASDNGTRNDNYGNDNYFSKDDLAKLYKGTNKDYSSTNPIDSEQLSNDLNGIRWINDKYQDFGETQLNSDRTFLLHEEVNHSFVVYNTKTGEAQKFGQNAYIKGKLSFEKRCGRSEEINELYSLSSMVNHGTKNAIIKLNKYSDAIDKMLRASGPIDLSSYGITEDEISNDFPDALNKGGRFHDLLFLKQALLDAFGTLDDLPPSVINKLGTDTIKKLSDGTYEKMVHELSQKYNQLVQRDIYNGTREGLSNVSNMSQANKMIESLTAELNVEGLSDEGLHHIQVETRKIKSKFVQIKSEKGPPDAINFLNQHLEEMRSYVNTNASAQGYNKEITTGWDGSAFTSNEKKIGEFRYRYVFHGDHYDFYQEPKEKYDTYISWIED